MDDKSHKSGSTGKDGSDSHHVPSLANPHTRRMSRMVGDNPLQMNHASRRMSMYRRPSVASYRSTEQSLSMKRPPKLENTYQLEPKEGESLSIAKIEKALNSILNSFLDGEDYDAKKCTLMTQNLTEVIKSRVKDMDFPRYKFVCNVAIGQNTGQCLQYASRCVWNTNTDNCAWAYFKNRTLYAVAVVYGVYFE